MRSAPAALVLLALATTAAAQNSPPPPTPFPPPIIGYDGRYVDSAQTLSFQFPIRTIRAFRAKPAPELNLMLMALSGSAFGAYDLGTMPSRLAAPARATGSHGEKFLTPDLFFDAQGPTSGFQIVLLDGTRFLRDFDYDLRGDFYLAYSAWGFGLIDRNGHLLSQVLTPVVGAQVILSVNVGGSYYALVSDGSSTAVYDVTNAAAPLFVRLLSVGIFEYAKTPTTIAIVTGAGTIRFYTPAALVAGNAASQELAPKGFTDVTTDGSRFFATFQSPAAGVATLTPQGNSSYSETDTPLGSNVFTVSINYGAGYLAVATIEPPASTGLILFSVGAAGLTRYSLSSYVQSAYSFSTLFRPASHDAVPFSSGATTHLLLAYESIGDVFQLAAATPIPATTLPALAVIALALAAIAAMKLR